MAAPSDTPVGSPPSTVSLPSPDIDFTGTEAAEECETDSHGHSCDDIALQKNTATQTDMTSGYIGQLEKEVNNLMQENFKLKSEIKNSQMSEETFADSDRVQGYTALPNLCIFLMVLDIISPVIHGSRCYLTKFQQLMLCLMRLRFNLSLIVLADIFKVSTTSASTIFHSVLHALYIRTKPFINWPERDCLHRTMPLEFKKYFGNKVTVIIDCFEVFIERPSSLQPRAQSYSNYKHSNTSSI